ncbi:hypothetical protein Ciccas_008813, partial [Cichlidogyrus casuarinus]
MFYNHAVFVLLATLVEGNWRDESVDRKTEQPNEEELLPTPDELNQLPPLLRVIYQLLQLIKCPPPYRQIGLKLEYKSQDPVITRCILMCLVYLCH